MLELLGNLLDNACKWAKGRVLLSASLGAQGLSLAVADDGPGVAPEQRAAILQRGRRLDEDVAGEGLGLAIVADLIEVYGGRLALTEAAQGGLKVDIFLPAPRWSVRSEA